MKVDGMKNTHRFLYHGWNVSIQLNGTDAHGAIDAHADLQRYGSEPRRIVIDQPCRDCGAALRGLAQGARLYVDDWRSGGRRVESLSNR
jgi:hypothetical protein